MTLKYVGGGFLAGVPARDLTDEEAEQFGGEKALVASGLYEAAGQETQSAATVASKATRMASKATKEGE